MAAIFKFKQARGSGFHTSLGAIRDVRPSKKPGKAVVCVLWGKNHKATGGHRSQVMKMEAVGDWKKLRARWLAMRGAQQ